MAHLHSVYDSDPHFVIDPVTRAITNTSSKTILMQYDHNSERFSFELNKLVEGHDITQCNSVQIHYLNADINRQDSNAGVYEVNDMIIDPNDENRVIFTWLVSNNATLYAGSLSFLIVFACIEEDEVVYRWNTNINTSVSIAKGMNNGEAITEEYPDILAQWLDELCKVASGAGVIAAGPIEPDTYPYIWLDTSEFVGTADKNVGYLTIKPADGKVQRIYPMVKMGSIEGLLDELKKIREAHKTDMEAVTTEFGNVRDEFANADNELSEQLDRLETILTGAVTAISHSLTGKGVDVPTNMSITDVSGLIDTINTDIPTELKQVIVMRNPNKTVYNNGDVFDPTGMEVLAVFTDGVSVYADEKSQSYYPNTMTTGTTSVRVHVFAGSKALYDTVSVTVNATSSGGGTGGDTPDIPDTSNTLASLSVGDMVAVRTYYNESNSPVDGIWLVADTDYYGNVLLVNFQSTGEWVKYHNSAPSSAYSNKYDGSAIDWHLKNTYYNAMPTETQNILVEVDIPVRASANSSTEQNYLSRKVFTLSSVEWGLGSTNYEGEEIEGSHLANTGESYWTREPVGGMTNTAYYIDENGVRRSDTATVNNKVRAAICMAKTQPITTSGSISYINYDGTSGGGNSGSSTTKTLSGVAYTPDYTSEYTVGQSFDRNSITIHAVYNDNTSEVVTDYTVNPSVFSEGDTSVTIYVTKNGVTKTATLSVTVTASGGGDSGSTTKTLESITLDRMPNKTNYTAGESFNPAGMIISAVYSDGSVDEDIDSYTYNSDALIVDMTYITIWVMVNGVEKYVNVPITVTASTTKELVMVVFGMTPDKTEYTAGEYFDPSGMIVHLSYSDGSTEQNVTDYTFSPGLLTAGTTYVTISVTRNGITKSANMPVTVNPASSGITPANLTLGDTLQITNSNGYTDDFLYVDSDYDGCALFVSKYLSTDVVPYYEQNPSSEQFFVYPGSTLDNYLNTTYYNSLPTTVANAIQSVDVPVKTYYQGSETNGFISRKVFVLSAKEWNMGGSESEFWGSPIEFTAARNTSVNYWTRETMGYMTGTAYAYHISSDDGELYLGGSGCQTPKYTRPAFCLSKTQSLTKVSDGVYTIA